MLRLTTAARGAAAGLTATAAMSAFLIAARGLGILPGLPPRMIVDRLVPGLRSDVADTAAAVSHAAYGAAGGAVFALMRGGRGGAWSGVGYAVLLWAAGYEGWVPALRVLPPAHRDRPSRAAVMVAAHCVYGFVLGRRLGTR